MGLFALTSTALSTYIWIITAWDVCRPLSSSSNSPFSILDLVRPQAKSSIQRAQKRSHAKIEATQRENIRRSLKATVIWLILKGLEPVFDNSIGYLMPFYSLSKTITLMVFICFRPELTRHLFDTFVLPIGKPNSPLLDLGAFNSIVIPTARFLLSLPFAHLLVAVKDQMEPILEMWSHRSEEEATEHNELQHRRLSNDMIAPPPTTQRVASGSRQLSTRSSSSSLRSVNGKGGRDDDGHGGNSHELPFIARSKEPLSNVRKEFTPRSSSVAQARTLLNSIPPAPKDALTSQTTTTPAGSINHPVLQAFAFIPPSTPPATQFQKASSINPSQLFTPRMPGFLGGQAQENGFNYARVSSAPSSSLGINYDRTETQSYNGVGRVDGSEAVEGQRRDKVTPVQGGIILATKSVTSTARRKRAGDISEVPLPLKKVRASPSKARARGRASPSVSVNDDDLAGTIKKSTSTARLPSSSLAPPATRSTISRTRKKAA